MNQYSVSNISKLCIFSYNSRGFHESKQKVCQDLLTVTGDKIPILCNQENFILKSNKYRIKQALRNFHIYFKAATKDGLSGRPKNGMFIAVPEVLTSATEDVSPPSSRVQAVVVKLKEKRLLIVNVYFPTDPRTDEFDTDELLTTIESINNVIDKSHFTDAVITGDINCDFSRRTKFVEMVQNFIEEKSLVKSWDKFEVDFTHANEIKGKTHVSKIDHYFWNENLSNLVSDAGVLHLPDNLSDHCPIYCTIEVKDSLKINTPFRR